MEEEQLLTRILWAGKIDTHSNGLTRPDQYGILVAKIRSKPPVSIHSTVFYLRGATAPFQHTIKVSMQVHRMGHAGFGIADTPNFRGTFFYNYGRTVHIKSVIINRPAAHMPHGQTYGAIKSLDAGGGDVRKIRWGFSGISLLFIHQQPQNGVSAALAQTTVTLGMSASAHSMLVTAAVRVTHGSCAC